GITQPAIEAIVGWRNYFSAQPSGTFPNFVFNSAAATSYVNSVLSNTTGFMTVPIPIPAPTSRTDQLFPTRQSLIQLGAISGFTSITNALQYLTTFSRELNAPTWTPSTPAGIAAGSTFDYAFQANTPTADTSTAINRDLLKVRAVGAFTRADGTTTAVGDLLIKQRFPLSRINGIGPTGVNTAVNSTIINGVLQPATDPAAGGGTISRDFGLHWNTDHWDYVGPTGTTV